MKAKPSPRSRDRPIQIDLQNFNSADLSAQTSGELPQARTNQPRNRPQRRSHGYSRPTPPS
ncbi:hypothetical protein [Oxynema aestuarii]|uniref:Uncharacterized protein n=1 Tax=Oxynema aestuarii AP17 TaxID=2064643 RepID=A0A6H1TWA6_9CYAN|nr:hypothetical protein [Oxynema aestuarii]QIZ70220.1 hypothetical protein HCG48_06250 [Oxynema aestuarii AP17]